MADGYLEKTIIKKVAYGKDSRVSRDMKKSGGGRVQTDESGRNGGGRRR